MNALILILALLGTPERYLERFPDNPSASLGGTATSDIHHPDNTKSSFGNTLAVPDVWFDNNGTAMCFTSTDVDAAGTDGDIWCYTLTGNLVTYTAEIRAPKFEVTAGEYLESGGTDKVRMSTAGAERVTWTTTELELAANYDIKLKGTTARIYDSTQALTLGTNAATGHSLGTGDALVGGKLEVDDSLFVDAVAFFYGTGTKGASTNMRTITESVTFANDASKVTTGSIIPAGSFVVGVSSRVVTAGAGCTSVDIGIAGKDIDAFADGTAVADTTTTTTSDGNSGAIYGNNSTDATALDLLPSIGAQEITVTANGGNCTAGVWALTVHYMDVTAATAD